MSGLNGPRSRSGCWTCRARKVKCDETRPKCDKCIKRNRECVYEPRKRAPRGSGQGPCSLHLAMYSKYKTIAIAPTTSSVSPASTLVDPDHDLPYGIKAADWPLPLTTTDRRALGHYAANVVPRMILKTARWSSYSYVLFMCAKHPLLAHLVTAFSVRDMAKENETDLFTIAMEHYQKALSLFIAHLSAPHMTGWVTFPALWLFIVYEQTYGDDPNVLRTHLWGVREIIITHGAAILPGSLHDDANAGQDAPPKHWVPPQMIDRMALWTIHHDAKASTFGLGASIVSLLDEHYPGAIAKICKSSTNALQDAWGPDYPLQEEIWDMQIEILFGFAHDATMLRYELSDIEKDSGPIEPRKLLSFSRKLKELQEKTSNLCSMALSRRIERSDILSNTCVTAAETLGLVIRHDRLLYENRLSSVVSQVLQICYSIYEYEGDGYLWRAAWPMFVAAFETKDPIHQAWILERFAALQAGGQNMRRAHNLLKAVFMDMRINTQPRDYLAWIRDERFPGFVI